MSCLLCVFQLSVRDLGEVAIANKSSEREIPARTMPMIPEMCFTSSTKGPIPFGATGQEGDGLSSLLVCLNCKVCVHASKGKFVLLYSCLVICLTNYM